VCAVENGRFHTRKGITRGYRTRRRIEDGLSGGIVGSDEAGDSWGRIGSHVDGKLSLWLLISRGFLGFGRVVRVLEFRSC